jgi:hypothetical protein
MDGQWLTYRELANRLSVGVEAARRRAQRACWTRQHGNDGKTRVHLPADYEIERRPDGAGAVLPLHPNGAPDAILPERETIAALEGHVSTLKADVERLEAQLRLEADRLAAAEARAEKQTADLVADLVAERARTEKAVAEFGALVDRLTTLADEKAKTDKAIAAFAALAERLDALAAERARPWWRRLVG